MHMPALHMPPAQEVPSGLAASEGQLPRVPLQTSAASQSLASSRQIVPAG